MLLDWKKILIPIIIIYYLFDIINRYQLFFQLFIYKYIQRLPFLILIKKNT